MGYNQNVPNQLKFGPIELGGCGLKHLFAEQGTEKIMFMLMMMRSERPAGKITNIQLQWAQRVAGTSEPILEATDTNIPHLNEELWICTLREFLRESNLSIHISNICTSEGYRENDGNIMDKAISEKNFQ